MTLYNLVQEDRIAWGVTFNHEQIAECVSQASTCC
jgi:hypothetical protein